MNNYLEQYESFIKSADQTLQTFLGDYPLCSMYYVSGLYSEASKVSGLYQHEIRQDGTTDVSIDRKELVSELGDVLWYLTRLANLNQIHLEEIIEENINKLKERHNATKNTAK